MSRFYCNNTTIGRAIDLLDPERYTILDLEAETLNHVHFHKYIAPLDDETSQTQPPEQYPNKKRVQSRQKHLMNKEQARPKQHYPRKRCRVPMGARNDVVLTSPPKVRCVENADAIAKLGQKGAT